MQPNRSKIICRLSEVPLHRGVSLNRGHSECGSPSFSKKTPWNPPSCPPANVGVRDFPHSEIDPTGTKMILWQRLYKGQRLNAAFGPSPNRLS